MRLPTPSKEGEKITGLKCPVGWCGQYHAFAEAKQRTISGKSYLVWVWSAPCLEAVHKQAIGG